MSNNDSEVTPEKGFDIEHPGAIIYAARQKQKLSIEELETATRIPKRKIKLLEDGEYARLGSSVYIVGYIRKIAALLEDLDGDILVENFRKRSASSRVNDVQDLDSTQSFLSKQFDKHLPVKISDRSDKKLPVIPFILVLIVAAIIFGTTLWKRNAEPLASQNSVETLTPENSTVDISPAADPELDQSSTNDMAHVEERGSSVDTAVDMVDEVVVPDDGSEADIAEASKQNDESSTNISDANISNEKASVAKDFESPVNDLKSRSANRSKELVLEFTEDSWVQVKDAGNLNLFTGIKTAGTSLELEGEAPFSLVLGVARGVNILHKGEPVEFVPTPGKKTLRLKVPTQ